MEEDPEEGWGEHAALLDSTVDGKWVGCCAIEAHSALHVGVEGLDDGVKLWGTADLLQELEEATSTDKVKRLCQI